MRLDARFLRARADSRQPLTRWESKFELSGSVAAWQSMECAETVTLMLTVQVRAWGRPPVCQLAGPLARRFDANRNTESETP